jgi:hypothetical protein
LFSAVLPSVPRLSPPFSFRSSAVLSSTSERENSFWMDEEWSLYSPVESTVGEVVLSEAEEEEFTSGNASPLTISNQGLSIVPSIVQPTIQSVN